jgi:predicted permease
MRVYQALLHLYPSSFRAEYGEELDEVLEARLSRATGLAARLAIWAGALFDILHNAPPAHLDILRQDLRYTLRALGGAPGFTLTAVLVIALGVGANTAAFSLADYVLIRPLPFPEPNRLVKLWENLPGYSRMELSPANYRDWQRMNGSFAAMGALVPQSANLVGQGDPQRIEGDGVSASLFPLLGVQPAMGHLFTESDDRDGAPGTVLLSWSMWQTQFGGDAGILGRRLLLDGTPCTVIGVMPADFHFPSKTATYWVPLQLNEQAYADRNNNFLQAVARLKPGVTLSQAVADMGVVSARLRAQYPGDNKNVNTTVYLLGDDLPSQPRLLLLALCGASLCILLIACANVASLLLARALGRRKELAVRAALGAGRARLVRQLITESLALALLGGVLGVLVAISAVPLLAKLIPTGMSWITLPLAQEPSVDFRVLVFAGLLTCITGLAFGVVPALRACSGSGLGGLREGERSGGGQRERLRAGLVIAEVMASVVLLISAGLLMRALWRVQATDPGFRAEGVVTLLTALPSPKYDQVATRAGFYDRVLNDARALPGVSSAAYISFLPMAMGGGIWPVNVDGKTLDRSEGHTASMRFVTPGFFSSLGIPIHQGRDVSEADTRDTLYTAVVSESLALRYWPGESPLGQHFQFGLHDRTIVGVVGDIKVRGLERTSEPQVYLPYKQVNDGWLVFYMPKNLVVRAAGDPMALLPALRRIIHEADPEQPVSDVQTMTGIVEQETASRSLEARVLEAFAALAFLLAAVGIHGLLAFTVSQRSREIGVRMALGATAPGIAQMVFRQGVLLALSGILPGLALAFVAGRAMESLLAGVKPGDPLTFLAAAALCAVMTVGGSLLPAVRAARTDPALTLRAE